ncbi:MAG: EAL domain-containing protein [Gemmatimonadaceae bacterium]|nr:EAL domain-containing protein [Acetobacteraceae bacterium]
MSTGTSLSRGVGAPVAPETLDQPAETFPAETFPGEAFPGETFPGGSFGAAVADPRTTRSAASAEDRVSSNRRELELDLREALNAGQFELAWQPIVNCMTGVLHRFEALIRWDRPGTGKVSPATFVPIAEALGLYRQLDTWVLKAACAEALRWPHPYRLAVNISANWFQGEDLSHAVEAALNQSGVDPSRLELEVTERVFIDNAGNAQRELAQLKALGVGLSLDDFGTGYSSLSYLRSIPFDKLKLDRLFIDGLGTDRRTEVITRAVLQMGAGLGMTVCAEGIAHQAQLEILQAYACDEVQGYLIGRPSPLTPERFTLYTRLDRSSLFLGSDSVEPGSKAAP